MGTTLVSSESFVISSITRFTLGEEQICLRIPILFTNGWRLAFSKYVLNDFGSTVCAWIFEIHPLSLLNLDKHEGLRSKNNLTSRDDGVSYKNLKKLPSDRSPYFSRYSNALWFSNSVSDSWLIFDSILILKKYDNKFHQTSNLLAGMKEYPSCQNISFSMIFSGTSCSGNAFQTKLW